MVKPMPVKYGNILLSLSDSIDLAGSQITSHQMRTAFIAGQIALAAGLPRERTENLIVTSLFHDIGALSLEEKIRLHEIEEIDAEAHCVLGEALFGSIPLFAPGKKIVRNHHRAWDCWDQSIDWPEVFDSQVLFLADYLERKIDRSLFILHQMDALDKKIASVSGTLIHHDVVDLFRDISKRESFWLDLASPRLYSILLNSKPFQEAEIAFEDISSIALLFRNIIDFKSRFTATHSTGVAECAVLLARIFGLPEFVIMQMEVAAFFHDLGKLAVPNSILEKPGRLTEAEFAVMKQHTYITHTVLETIGGLGDIAKWAAYHHESLDGTGYPYHIKGEEMDLQARILKVADVFTALSEHRPYRKGMDRKEIERILKSLAADRKVDGKIVKALIDDFKEISTRIREKQEQSRETFEMLFDKYLGKAK